MSDMAGIPVFLDVTDPTSTARAAMICGMAALKKRSPSS